VYRTKGVKTDGATGMTGKETGLRGRIRREVGKQDPKSYTDLHYIIDFDTLKSEIAMSVVV
jgi:hypothetical protein